jgi:hypothetical protein
VADFPNLIFSDHGEGIPYLVSGIGFDGYSHQKYSTNVFEYTSHCSCYVCSHPQRDITPHVILVGVQENIIGHDDWITYGELTSIVTAMRYRAFDPSAVKESDDNEQWVDRGDLRFKNEERFPVSDMLYVCIFCSEINSVHFLGHHGFYSSSSARSNLLRLHGRLGSSYSAIEALQPGEERHRNPRLLHQYYIEQTTERGSAIKKRFRSRVTGYPRCTQGDTKRSNCSHSQREASFSTIDLDVISKVMNMELNMEITTVALIAYFNITGRSFYNKYCILFKTF